MKKRFVVFLCMPITPRSPSQNHAIEYLGNLRKGFEVAAELISRGFAVYCPATDFAYWFVKENPKVEDIYEQDMSILLKCDAILALDGWRASENCKKEVTTANENGVHVAYTIDGLENWRSIYRDEDI